MLGAYIVITGAVSEKFIEEELRDKYREKEKVLKQNLDAFKRGVELGKSAV